ncbi:hypothetical protein [Streptomyces sp. TRM64462]|uniref:hypothetical protein n=1 Tax=Streptomyces sp. TRM64462 TaxID=2741726 RepID=UPI001586F157|nr:hypothetical protein [Streptomyces sp. TRM64462]
MARQREEFAGIYDGDFGLSALTEKLSSAPASLDDAQAWEYAAAVAAVCDGEGAVELGVDVRCLLDSALPDEVLRTAWLAATRERFDPADFGMDVRGWLRRLADLCPARVRKRAHHHWPAPPRSDMAEEELCEAVVREMRNVAAEVTHTMAKSGSAAPLSESVPAALERIVEESDGELGFRLLLRVLKAYRVPVGKDQYDRLMELDHALRYPGPVVYDGLNVQWLPIDTTRRDATGDFGFSELTSWFAGDWHAHTARETVQKAAAGDDTAETPGSAAALLREDALRLLESTLSSDTITTLWVAASERGFSIDRFSIDARYWLGLIVEECDKRLREVAPSYTPVMQPVRVELTDEVLREVREVAPLLSERIVSPDWHGIPGATVVQAVEEVVTRVDPDLGFRLFLRVLFVLSVPLTEEQYSRYEMLCGRFGYGAYHLLELDQFVQRG